MVSVLNSVMDDKEYEHLLDNIYKNLPEKSHSAERFEIPKFQHFVEGNKTIIKNFKAVNDKIRRDGSILSKYLSKELAVPVEQQGERLVVQRKIPMGVLDNKLEEFIAKYVICKECKRPDTKIIDVGGFKQLVCESCGARTSIK